TPPPPRSPLFPYTTLFRSTSTPFSSRTTPAQSAGSAAQTGTHATTKKQSNTAANRRPASITIPDDHFGLDYNLRRCCFVFSLLRSEEHTSELQSQSNLVCR